MNVALGQRTPLLERVARVLAADEAVTSVSYWRVGNPAGVVVAEIGDPARSNGAFVVSRRDTPEPHGISKCNPNGLAAAMAAVHNGTLTRTGVARPDGAAGDVPIIFPVPIGRQMGSAQSPTELVTPSDKRFMGLIADVATEGETVQYSVVDDAEFFAAVCWASGVIAAIKHWDTHGNAISIEPVDVASDYLRACQDAGLVIAQRSATD